MQCFPFFPRLRGLNPEAVEIKTVYSMFPPHIAFPTPIPFFVFPDRNLQQPAVQERYPVHFNFTRV